MDNQDFVTKAYILLREWGLHRSQPPAKTRNTAISLANALEDQYRRGQKETTEAAVDVFRNLLSGTLANHEVRIEKLETKKSGDFTEFGGYGDPGQGGR